MNIRKMGGGLVFDSVRQLNLHGRIFGFSPTTHQQLFIVSLAFEIVLFPVIYFLRRDANAPITREPHRAAPGFWSRSAQPVRQSAVDTAQLFRRLIGASGSTRILNF